MVESVQEERDIKVILQMISEKAAQKCYPQCRSGQRQTTKDADMPMEDPQDSPLSMSSWSCVKY